MEPLKPLGPIWPQRPVDRVEKPGQRENQRERSRQGNEDGSKGGQDKDGHKIDEVV